MQKHVALALKLLTATPVLVLAADPNYAIYTPKIAQVAPVIVEQKGVQESEELSAFREKKAKAEAGDPKGQVALGLIYLVGGDAVGVKKDSVIAESWFLRAAKKGNKIAFTYLREIHGRRAGELKASGKSDTEEVTKFLMFALLYGRDRDFATSMISDATKAEARKRAEQFRLDNGISLKEEKSQTQPAR
jgi:TPR repeat protein